MTTNLVSSAITHKEINLAQALHGEQYLEVIDELPTEGHLTTTGKILDVVDKRSGALVVVHCEFYFCSKLFEFNVNLMYVLKQANHTIKTVNCCL